MPYFVYLSKREYRVHVDIHILVCYKLNGIKNYKGSIPLPIVPCLSEEQHLRYIQDN